MSHPVITDPIHSRRQGGKSKGSSFVSFPIILIAICAFCGLPMVNSRLWALDGAVHAHNDAIVSVIMMVAPFFLVAMSVLGIMVFIRAGRVSETEF